MELELQLVHVLMSELNNSNVSFVVAAYVLFICHKLKVDLKMQKTKSDHGVIAGPAGSLDAVAEAENLWLENRNQSAESRS